MQEEKVLDLATRLTQLEDIRAIEQLKYQYAAIVTRDTIRRASLACSWKTDDGLSMAKAAR